MEKDIERKWLNITAAANYLSFSKSTLYQYVAKRQIPFYKVPGSNALRFSADELEAWMAGGKK